MRFDETVYSATSVLRQPRAFLAGTLLDVRRSPAIAGRLLRSELRAGRRQSLLGHAWLLIPAAATALVCSYLQRRGIVTLQETALPYPLFVLAGVLLWQTFTDALNAPLQQLAAMRQLITRSRVPHEAVVAAGAAGALLNAAIRLAVLVLLLPFFGAALGPSLLLLPLGFAALVLLGLALGLLAAPFGLLYGDVGRGLPLVTSFWFFLTPVAYPIAESSWLRLNPVAPLIDVPRSWLIAPSMPPSFVMVVAGAAAALALGILLYRVARPHLLARLG
jgi:lipopolysaccharide transport system permease protein